MAAVPLLGAAAASAALPAVSGLTSTTHPDPAAWYPNADPELQWDALAGAAGYSWVLDQQRHDRPRHDDRS